jgi:hypothetical protein
MGECTTWATTPPDLLWVAKRSAYGSIDRMLFFQLVLFSLQVFMFHVHDDRYLSIWDFYTH